MSVTVLRRVLIAACLASALPLVGPSPAAVGQTVGCATHGALPAVLTHVTGFPPRHAFQLPASVGATWSIAAVDNQRVLLVRLGTAPGGSVIGLRPVHLSTLTIGTTAVQPVPAGAFPPQWETYAEFSAAFDLRIEGNWVVGRSRVDMHGTWELWAGNLQTGAMVVVDRSADLGAIPETPLFALEGGRVLYAEHRSTGSRMLLFDLQQRRATVVATAARGISYGSPALSGNLAAWYEFSQPRSSPPVFQGLIVKNLRTGSRSVVVQHLHLGSFGMTVGISGSYVVYGPTPELGQSSGGPVVLVEVQSGRSWTLDPTGNDPAFSQGLAMWETYAQQASTASFFDLSRGTTWTLQDIARVRRHGYTYGWSPEVLGGRVAEVYRFRPGSAKSERISFWTVPPAC